MKMIRSGVKALFLAVVACQAGAAPIFKNWEVGLPPPLHPTIIEGTYKGKDLPITSVSHDSPQVEVDGKVRSLSNGSTARYRPRRGVAFAPGGLTLKEMSVNSSKMNLVLMFSNGSEVSGGTLSARSDFSAIVVPTRDYSDCYVAIVFFDQDYLDGKTNESGASVQFNSIKPLLSGKENKIQLTFGYMDFGARRTGYFPLFFSHGLEIQSNQSELVARFFRHGEDLVHQAVLRSYLQKNVGASQPLQPYMRIPPIFPEGAHLESLPRSITASFMVSEEGRVESIQIPDSLPGNVFHLLKRTLNGWLFLPRLKDGRPMRTMVTLPLVLPLGGEPQAQPAGT